MSGPKKLDKREKVSLSKLVACDLFEKRPCGRVDGLKLDEYAGRLASLATDRKLVYTAFNGDHQMMCSYMRRLVAAHGHVPANPDSILGYKDTLKFRQTKRGVLLDDLSVLRGCDELWIFTEMDLPIEKVPLLAEGVLVELFYFRRRHPDRAVRVINIADAVFETSKAEAILLEASYEELVAALGGDQRDEILKLSNSGVKVDRELRSINYFISDPLDYKYARFLREHGYATNVCPLIPYLAVRPEDFQDQGTSLIDCLLSWARLMSLASTCTKLPGLDPDRPTSQIVEVMERVWLRKLGSNRIDEGTWTEFHVPKANQGERWAITARERSAYEG